MKKVLITSNATYGSGATASYDITSLTAGAIAAFDPAITGGVDMIDSAGSNIVGNEIFFAVGNAETDTFISPLINKASLTYYKQAYVAPVAKVMTYGDDANTAISFGTMTALNGKTLSIIFVDLDKPIENTTKYIRYDHVVTLAESNGTDDSLCTAMVAEMNADPRINYLVTAAVEDSDAGFRFTAKTVGSTTQTRNFHIIPAGDFVTLGLGGAVTVVTAHVTGFGCPWQVAKDYQAAMVEHGYNPHHSGLQEGLWSLTSVVGASSTYTGWALTWKAHKSERRQQIDTEGNFAQELMIYVPSGDAALIAAIDAILSAFTAV